LIAISGGNLTAAAIK